MLIKINFFTIVTLLFFKKHTTYFLVRKVLTICNNCILKINWSIAPPSPLNKSDLLWRNKITSAFSWTLFWTLECFVLLLFIALPLILWQSAVCVFSLVYLIWSGRERILLEGGTVLHLFKEIVQMSVPWVVEGI